MGVGNEIRGKQGDREATEGSPGQVPRVDQQLCVLVSMFASIKYVNDLSTNY